MTEASRKIAYLVGMGHSGSTLLDLLISGHPEVVSAGEAKMMSPRTAAKASCYCPAGLVSNCPFWQRVSDELQARSSLHLFDLDVESPDEATFIAHNRAFFDAIGTVTQRRIIVDSSKSIDRLSRLLAAGCFDIEPIHLVRRPHGIVYSQMKKGRSWLRYSRLYSQRIQRIRALLRGTDHSLVRYEELAADPAAVLSELMPRLGVAFEARQLDWSDQERHDCGGNRMRLERSGSIRLDREWESGLTPWQKLAVSVLTARAKI